MKKVTVSGDTLKGLQRHREAPHFGAHKARGVGEDQFEVSMSDSLHDRIVQDWHSDPHEALKLIAELPDNRFVTRPEDRQDAPPGPHS